jgi:hypothetical protein
MLLSQRIAKDPKFLTKIDSGCTTNVFDLRMRIINASKIIVPHEFLNFDNNHGDNLAQSLANSSSTSMQEKGELYRIYARMPFSSMFIENDTGALFVQQTQAGFEINAISKQGEVHPYTTVFSGFIEGVSIPLPEIKWHAKAGTYFPDTVQKATRVSSLVYLYVAMDVMLFMNVKNVIMHHYVPTKKENSIVPKPLLAKYDYRVLDVFGDVKRYDSLVQVVDHVIGSSRMAKDRRAHLVRGHFKEFKNGLFGNPKLAGLYWWNPFRRSRKNLETVGVVEKDYRLSA